MNRIHFDNITDYHRMLGKPDPQHPQLSVSTVKADTSQGELGCINSHSVISADFYAISLKNIISGDLVYGKTKYDYRSGTMLFLAPRQEFYANGITIASEGKVILFHEDFIRNHAIYDLIKKCSFFAYAVNEALHLSAKEEAMIKDIFTSIEAEYHSNYDAFSRDIILAQISALLTYADRFYHRQFLLRKESCSSISEQFVLCFDELLATSEFNEIPAIIDIADKLNMTSRYLTDALKVETGKSAKEWIQLRLIDKAKNLLLSRSDSVATIAYSLGFEYPQYFARLFKKKVGLTPTQYRNQPHYKLMTVKGYLL
ncbi:MAG: AraC-like DNA-binding protein [Moritella sp.]|jgi:AraC-like DNA-binding protein